MKHKKFVKQRNFYQICVKNEMYVCTCKIIAHAVTKQINYNKKYFRLWPI